MEKITIVNKCLSCKWWSGVIYTEEKGKRIDFAGYCKKFPLSGISYFPIRDNCKKYKKSLLNN